MASMAGHIPIKFAPAAVDSASHELTEAAVSNEAVERIAPKDETDAKAKFQSSGSVASFFVIAGIIFMLSGLRGFVFVDLATRSEVAFTPDPLKGINDFRYSYYEVLVLPGSNKDCSKKPDVDSLEFCVVLRGCPDTPETPGGRCGFGFEPGTNYLDKKNQNGVFIDGVNDRSGICQRWDNRKRIIAAAGSYSRSITTYQVNCVGPECNFWKTKSLRFNVSCVLDAIRNSSDIFETPREHCAYLEPLFLPWTKNNYRNDYYEGVAACSLYWPTFREVIRQKIPSTSSITDKYSQYVGGTFAISGPIQHDRDAWFNMCGFCSYSREMRFVVAAILFFGGVPLCFDLVGIVLALRAFYKWQYLNLHDSLCRHCFFHRQFWELLWLSKGHLNNFVVKLFRWNSYIGVGFACFFQYTVSNLIQLGFAVFSALYAGEDNSLLVDTSEILSFEVSVASSVLSTMNTCVFFFMFLKWRDSIKIIEKAKYSCAIFLLQLVDVVLSVVAISLAFYSLVQSRSIWYLFVFPVLKSLLTANKIISLYEHRPCRDGDDMLYFATCDSKVCVRETKQPHTAVENGDALNTLVVV